MRNEIELTAIQQTLNMLLFLSGARLGPGRQRTRREPYNCTPMGVNLYFARSSARTPHGGASYVQMSGRNQETHPPAIRYRPSPRLDQVWLSSDNRVTSVTAQKAWQKGFADAAAAYGIPMRVDQHSPSDILASVQFKVRVVNSRVQLHPDGGQFDFVWPSTRTMHPRGAYVWGAKRNQ